MKKYYFSFCIMLLVSCGNRPGTSNSEADEVVEESIVVKEKLDSILVKGVFELIRNGEHLKYPEIPLNESFIVIAFLFGGKPLSDSIVSITYFQNTFPIDKNLIYYKGMLNIDDYNVAIFDVRNFGDNYFNIDSLKQIPLSGFKRYQMDIVTVTFCVHNGELYYHGLEMSP